MNSVLYEWEGHMQRRVEKFRVCSFLFSVCIQRFAGGSSSIEEGAPWNGYIKQQWRTIV